MQIVSPIDIEDALRIDLSEIVPDTTFYASPVPDDLGADEDSVEDTVAFTQLGGGAASPVSNEHDVSVDVWAETPGRAFALANKIHGIIVSLPVRQFKSGRDYKSAAALLPYINPDPARPLIPRYTFSATIGIRGIQSI